MATQHESDDDFDIQDYDIDALIQDYEQEYEKETPLGDQPVTEKCSFCQTDKTGVYKLFKEIYGVLLCYECTRREEDFRLVTKTTLKDDLLLGDAIISERLRHIEKKNEKYGGWASIKLFLFCQVR